MNDWDLRGLKFAFLSADSGAIRAHSSHYTIPALRKARETVPSPRSDNLPIQVELCHIETPLRLLRVLIGVDFGPSQPACPYYD